jgi:hypothetical protein
MSLALKPTHATVKAYYDTLHQFGQLNFDHEGAVRSAFQTLLAKCGQKASPKLTFVPEYRISREVERKLARGYPELRHCTICRPGLNQDFRIF